MVYTRYRPRICWTPQMLSDLLRFLPEHSYEEVAGIIGVSRASVWRKAHQLGLKHSREWICEKHKQAKFIWKVKNHRL